MFEIQICYLDLTRSHCHMIIIAHNFTLSLVRQQKKGKNQSRSWILFCHNSISTPMLLHLTHTSPHTSSCIQVGSKQAMKNRVRDMHLLKHLTQNRFQSQISNHRTKIHHIGITNMTIIMLGSSYGPRSMKNKRERDQATTTNP